jgi:hypothetical protein
VKNDPEYFDNWVTKLDLLCKSQSEIGLLGSCFFLGVIMSVVWLPKCSDIYGRINFIILTFVVQTGC